MKLYEIDLRYYGTQAEAREAAKTAGVRFDADDHTVEVPTDKPGLIAFLNELVNDCIKETPGEDQFTTVVERQDPPIEPGESHSDKLVRFEDEFAALPLAAKLHYASLALEDARELVPQLATTTACAVNLAEEAVATLGEVTTDDDELFG